MKNRFSLKYKIPTLGLLLFAQSGIGYADTPVFFENSQINNVDFLFHTQAGNAEHISLAVDTNNNLYTAYHDAVTGKDLVEFVKYSNSLDFNGALTSLIDVTSEKADNTFSQLRVNPADNSLMLAVVEGKDATAKLKIKSSIDGGLSWTDKAIVDIAVNPRAMKMEVDSTGNAYILLAPNNTNAKLYKFDNSVADVSVSLTEVFSVTTDQAKSQQQNMLSGDIAIDGDDVPYFVYRDNALGAADLQVAYFDGAAWQSFEPSGPTIAGGTVNLSAAFDSQNNLHIVDVGIAASGMAVYKLNGKTADSAWELQGNEKFDHALSIGGSENGTTTPPANFYIDLDFDSKDVAYVAFQQVNNEGATGSSKRQMQLVKLVNDVWTEVPWDLGVDSNFSAHNSTEAASIYNGVHKYIDLVIDNLDRPIVGFQATNSATHSYYPTVVRGHLATADPDTVLPFSLDEGETLVGKLTADDADGDAITLTLSGADADLFTIDQVTGQISFKAVQEIAAENSVYTLTVSATANDETTNQDIQVTLINDTTNDIPDTDGDGLLDDVDPDIDGDGTLNENDAFPLDNSESVDTDNDGVGDNSDPYPLDGSINKIENIEDATSPVFIDNSVLLNELEFLFNPQTDNSEHLSMAVNSENTVYAAYQNAKGSADIVKVAEYNKGVVSDFGAQSSVATANTFTQIRINPVDDSLLLAFVENSKLIVKASTDGQAWIPTAETTVTAASKSVKMEVDSQGTPYILHTGSDNNTTIFKLSGSSLSAVYGPMATKSTNGLTVAADIAINSNDHLHLVYRDAAAGSATLDKTLLVSWDENGIQQAALTTTVAPTSAYMKIAFDSADNLHMFNVGFTTVAGGTVYKLDGTDVSDTSWQQVGDQNFGFALAEGHAAAPTTGKGSPLLDLAFDSNDVPYVAFQQMNNAITSKKHAQMATLVNDVWTEISYDLASVSKAGANLDNATHNFIDIDVDEYDRPLLLIRSGGTGHNAYGYALRVNKIISSRTIYFNENEGSLIAGKLAVIDNQGDSIVLSLTGADADLFDINQATGEISIKDEQILNGADETFNITVTATTAGETASANIEVTLLNDANNDPQSFDVTPSLVTLNKFSKVNNAYGGDNQAVIVSNTNIKPLEIGAIAQNDFFVTNDSCSNATLNENEQCTFTVQTFDPENISSDITVNNGIVTISSNNTDSPTFNLFVALGESDTSELSTSETVQEKAQRKVPPVVKNIVITSIGDDYTVNFELDGYHDEYQAGFGFFDCALPINNESCATSLENKIVSTQATFDNDTGTSPGSFSYTYNSETSSSLTFPYSATVDLSAYSDTGSNDLVLRFYYKAPVDSAAGNQWISAIIPGGQGYISIDGLSRKIIAPAANQ
ncbi:cadherin repeat domain-containing protein [Thalassotalea fonticola]|uniref:Cadherin repeat domain-containing protein n=1 Tax=Thalassotalea fonticola TaxID=3065649 RepID=A0ABZ0GRS9_9GAMM|nr:cadherin repeat domain-containing protein [Colwelliaceae bacterium S1-1]